MFISYVCMYFYLIKFLRFFSFFPFHFVATGFSWRLKIFIYHLFNVNVNVCVPYEELLFCDGRNTGTYPRCPSINHFQYIIVLMSCSDCTAQGNNDLITSTNKNCFICTHKRQNSSSWLLSEANHEACLI